jgi:alpha-methylacyl-CoA racemase
VARGRDVHDAGGKGAVADPGRRFPRRILRGRSPADLVDPAAQHQRTNWPGLRATFARAFLTKSRDEWCAQLDRLDICFAPVLSLEEAPLHPHNKARATFVELDGIVQPAPAPRFSATPGRVQTLRKASGFQT